MRLIYIALPKTDDEEDDDDDRYMPPPKGAHQQIKKALGTPSYPTHPKIKQPHDV